MAWLAEFRPDLVPRYEELYRAGAYAAEGLPALARDRARPLLRRHGLDRPFRDPTTGVAGCRLRGSTGVRHPGARCSPPSFLRDVAAAIQPTLF